MKEFITEVGSDLIDAVTTAAREGKLQVISSVWAVNEVIAVIDRKVRKKELTTIEVQTIIATLTQRIKDSIQNASFFFAPLEHQIVAYSRLLIDEYHISPDDALHLYTSWIYDCEYFLIHDRKIINRIKSRIAEGMTIIDLDSEKDRMYLAAQLGLSKFG
jgi:predicted nucleic acid-binding protein